MTLVRRKFLRLAGAALATSAFSSIAFAQTYPTRPVRMVVPFAAGGPGDLFARLVAQKLSASVGAISLRAARINSAPMTGESRAIRVRHSGRSAASPITSR